MTICVDWSCFFSSEENCKREKTNTNRWKSDRNFEIVLFPIDSDGGYRSCKWILWRYWIFWNCFLFRLGFGFVYPIRVIVVREIEFEAHTIGRWTWNTNEFRLHLPILCTVLQIWSSLLLLFCYFKPIRSCTTYFLGRHFINTSKNIITNYLPRLFWKRMF